VRRLLTTFYVTALTFSLSAIALGHALQINNGFYHPKALTWLTMSLTLAIVGTLVQRWSPTLSRRTAWIPGTILVLGIAWQLVQAFDARPGFYVSESASMALFRGLIVAQGVIILVGLIPRASIRRVWFPLFRAVSLGLGVWMIKASPVPQIDVVEVHKEALDALLARRDPYRITITNVYEPWQVRIFYNPKAVFGSRIAIGYPYPPASLLLAVPGYVLFSDYRYSELGLLIAGAALIGYSRRSRVAMLAACLLLTTPRVWFVIEQGWTEPIAIFMLALTAFFIGRSPVAAAFAGGILAVTKQYLGFSGLAILRLAWIRRPSWYWSMVTMALAAAATILPFALWHPNSFMRSVVWLQTQEPFRLDSLCYLSWAARSGMGLGSFIWAVGAAVFAAIISFATTKNTAAGLASSVAITAFTMFAFGSKAFCNYYFFVIGALCCAIAAFPRTEESTDRVTA
jgi:hypothetical protein